MYTVLWTFYIFSYIHLAQACCCTISFYKIRTVSMFKCPAILMGIPTVPTYTYISFYSYTFPTQRGRAV